MEKQIFELLTKNRQKDELAMLDAYNQKTEMFGLALTKEEAKALIVSRDESLKKYGRVEFGKGILDKLVYSFCDSQYISRENYLAVLTRLQDIFYHFKNESQDKLTDDELLTFMRQQYESCVTGIWIIWKIHVWNVFQRLSGEGIADSQRAGAQMSMKNSVRRHGGTQSFISLF